MALALVTGGAGFVGSHLAEALVKAGWQVRVLDDMSSGKRENLLAIAREVEVIEASVLCNKALAQAMAGVDTVFHQAARVSVPQSVLEPELFHDIIATGSLRVLLAARDAGVRRLIYAGSASAYGNTDHVPTDESVPVDPQSPYAAAKLAGEHYCRSLSATSTLETVVLRYFNIYGPRQDPSSPYSGVISIFCNKLKSGTTPTIFGDGEQTRDFVYVADIVQANIKAATAANVSGKTFNIGAGQRTSLLDLWTTLCDIQGTSLKPQHAPPRIGDVKHSQANITAAREMLHYAPTVGLADGLRNTLAAS